MTKRFKAVYNDACAIGPAYWQVWDSQMKYRYAEFYGKGCRQYAREHAEMLNSIREDLKP